jgi:hypothetical protein
VETGAQYPSPFGAFLLDAFERPAIAIDLGICEADFIGDAAAAPGSAGVVKPLVGEEGTGVTIRAACFSPENCEAFFSSAFSAPVSPALNLISTKQLDAHSNPNTSDC